MIRTVTCRQFPNLTFAPRKTRHFQTATSRFTAINVTAFSVYRISFIFARFFLFLLYFFTYNPKSGIFTLFTSKNHACYPEISLSITIDHHAIILYHIIYKETLWSRILLLPSYHTSIIIGKKEVTWIQKDGKSCLPQMTTAASPA